MGRTSLPPLPLPSADWERIAAALALPRQQRRIAELILRHQCDKQIASQLRIKLPTVRTHIGRIFSKLHISDREELILLVFRRYHEQTESLASRRLR